MIRDLLKLESELDLVPLLVALLLALIPVFAHAQGDAKKLNPFTGKPEAIKEGRLVYFKYGCSGCHGVGGGGGMGPPLSDDVWKYGSDDESVYKLIKGEVAASTMPKVFSAMTDDEIWKSVAYIRSVYAGDPSKVNW